MKIEPTQKIYIVRYEWADERDEIGMGGRNELIKIGNDFVKLTQKNLIMGIDK